MAHPSRPVRAAKVCGAAILAVTVASVLRAVLMRAVHADLPLFITYYPAVILVALFRGARAGMLATVLSVLVVDYFFQEPRYSFMVGTVGDAISLLLFGSAGFLVSWMGERIEKARRSEGEAAERLRSQEALARSAAETEKQRQLLAVTLASIGDAVLVTDAQGRITFLNPEAERLTGWPSSEAAGQPLPAVFRIINEQTRQRVENPVDKVLRLGTVVGLANHTILVARDGRETPIDDSAAPIRQPDGSVQGVVLVFRDFSERRAAEERTRLQSAALGSAANAIVITSREGVIQWVNEAFTRLTGYSAAEAIGQNPRTLNSGQHDVEFYKTMWDTVLAGRVWRGDLINRRKDGTLYEEEMTITPVPDATGTITHFIAIKQDNTQRKRAEEALRAARTSAEQAKAEAERHARQSEHHARRAEAANQAKDRFIAVLSHELRTPLTPALAAAGAMLRDGLLPERLREDVELIHRNIDLEVRLIADLLDVNRIAAGKMVLHKHPMDLAGVIRDAAQHVCADLDAKAQTLTIDCPGAPYIVEGDAARIQQVFWNLLKNAVKFTPDGGRLAIDCRAAAGRVSVCVRDTGIGIEPQVLSSIFDAFEQGDPLTTRQFGGLGLGLAICRAIVDMHAGAIRAESPGRGHGSTFIVDLPLSTAERLPPAVPAGSPAVPSQRVKAHLRILLVEDHADTARLMSRLLTSDGHEVATAGSVAAALAEMEGANFDVLVSDLGLPDGTGHDLMRRLLAANKRLPAIALSGYGSPEDIRLSREAGFIEHLTKPIALDDLHAALVRLCNGR